MLFADDQGRIYDHPDYLMVGRSADRIVHRIGSDRIVLPEMSRLFYLPKCRPVGLDPKTGRTVTLKHTKTGAKDDPMLGRGRVSRTGIRAHSVARDRVRRERLRAAPVGILGGGLFGRTIRGRSLPCGRQSPLGPQELRRPGDDAEAGSAHASQRGQSALSAPGPLRDA